MDTTTVLLVNAYFPCDNHSKTSVDAEYQAALDSALCLWIESDADVVILGGDLNTDISRNNAHFHALNQLAHNMNSDLAWRCSEAQQMDTFISSDGKGRSCIDHFVLSQSISHNISFLNVYDHVLNPSNHLPLFMNVDLDSVNRICGSTSELRQPSIAWGRITDVHITEYRRVTNLALSTLVVPSCVTDCRDSLCSSRFHCDRIDFFCEQLCKICSDAGTSCFPVSRPNKLSRPMWSERMKPYKDDALFWDSVWKSCDKPRDGIVFDLRQNTKREYHYALRRYKREERALRRERMGASMTSSDDRSFWKEVQNVNSKKRKTAPTIDSAVTDIGIANIFGDKYKTLYNSVPSNPHEMRSITSQLSEALSQTSTNAI
jgi:hypothetical protein